MNSKTCKPETLLNASTCEIQYCSECEMIHLMLGSMTLRIPTEHFKELAKDLGKGLVQLQAYKQSSTNFNQRSVYTLHS
ncbi:MAG: hypothetical protein COA95_01725 [Methylophaga sp.]|nr:MAG: hypothetical protein COA95_01725 [Methylophaga sp.]